MHLGAPQWMHAIWLAPLVVLLWVYAMGARRRTQRRFAEDELMAHLVAPTRRWAGVAKLLLTTIGMLALVLALMQPQWNKREIPVSRKGREVVFVVDVSRSMLAQDLAPSRLDRAKLWIRDVTNALDGDSVGLVAFAGAAVVKCPLTRDLGFFEMALEELNPDSAPRGGTNIGDAIRKTVSQVFELRPDDQDTQGQYRDLILITDGEDQDSLPVAAAESAAAAGVRIIALGLGSTDEGALVPDPDRPGSFLSYDGQQVRSTLDAKTLADIARATPGGVFLNVGTGNVDLEQVYDELVHSAEQKTLETNAIVQYQQMFWVFLAVGLAALMLEPLIEEQGRWSP